MACAAPVGQHGAYRRYVASVAYASLPRFNLHLVSSQRHRLDLGLGVD